MHPDPVDRAGPRRRLLDWRQLSIRQVEISRTLVFDDPRRARGLFEALVADNIGIGRPEQVSMVFARPLRRPAKTTYGTRVFTTGTEVRIDFRYRHCRIKQYLKDSRALRVEMDRSSTTRQTSTCAAVLSTCPSSSPQPARSTTGCLSSNAPARAVPSALRS